MNFCEESWNYQNRLICSISIPWRQGQNRWWHLARQRKNEYLTILGTFNSIHLESGKCLLSQSLCFEWRDCKSSFGWRPSPVTHFCITTGFHNPNCPLFRKRQVKRRWLVETWNFLVVFPPSKAPISLSLPALTLAWRIQFSLLTDYAVVQRKFMKN